MAKTSQNLLSHYANINVKAVDVDFYEFLASVFAEDSTKTIIV